MTDVSPQLDLDVGLVQVTFQHEPEVRPGHLSPEALSMSNPHFELQLEEVLYVPASQEQRLLAALQPRITHLEILQPWHFGAMLEQVLEWLRNRGRKMAPSDDRNKMRRAAQTLEEFQTLVGLLRRFQHALHRG